MKTMDFKVWMNSIDRMMKWFIITEQRRVIYGPPRIARKNSLFDKKNNASIYPALG